MAIDRKRFQDSVNELAKYFGIINQKDVASMIGLDNIERNKISNEVTQKKMELPSVLDLELNKLIIDDFAGALTINSLSTQIDNLLHGPTAVPENELESQIKEDIVKIYKEKEINSILSKAFGQSQYINSSVERPTKENPNLSVIKINSVRVGPEKRFADAATIFLNGIPTIEMSRAVPYLELQFMFPRAPLNDENIMQTMSLPKFLYGAQKVSPGSPMHSMVDGLKISATELKTATESKKDFYTGVGMEIFTSPQTLVNADNVSQNRANPVLNKFAPFLTLKKLDLNVVPSTGIMSYKAGNLTLTLHDRSRLNEIAEFLKPDLYGRTELTIEYGWIHPDGERIVGEKNIYGDFINGLRVKERYFIVNSSFTFDEGGAITITLKIAMKGATDFELISSSDDTEKLSNSLKNLEELQKAIEEYKNRLYKNSSEEKIKEIRGIQILDAAMDARNHLELSGELKKSLSQFRNTLNQSKSTADAKGLLSAIDAMFPTKNNNKKNNVAVTTDVRTSLQDMVRGKIEKLALGSDPFFPNKDEKETVKKRGKLPYITKGGKKSAFKGKFEGTIPLGVSVSLGKLLLFFLGEPLAGSKKFDDVQLIFHTFNSNAGAVKDKNIAEFPVDLDYFTEQYYRLRESNLSKSVNLNLRQFLGFLADIILDDMASPGYGLIDGKSKPIFKRKEDGRAEAADTVPVFEERINAALKKHGISDGVFKIPKIQFLIEAYPERAGGEDGSNKTKDSGATILKIHVIDQANSSFDTLSKIVTAQRDAGLSVFSPNQSNVTNTNLTTAEQTKKSEANRLLDMGQKADFLEPLDTAESDQFTLKSLEAPRLYRIKGGQAAMKKFLMQTMPYIIYGAAGTTIKAANLASQQIPELTTVNLQRSYQKSDLDPTGQHPGGLPMQIIPTQLTLQTMGMPLINFAQTFFIDFQTGTTADNIYAVIGLNHSFEPGNFTTEIKLTPLDAFGQYISLSNRLTEAFTLLSKMEKDTTSV